MLDLKFVRGNPQKVQEALASRGSKLSLKEFLQLDEQRREKLFVVEQMKNRRYYNPTGRGYEKKLKEFMDKVRKAGNG